MPHQNPTPNQQDIDWSRPYPPSLLDKFMQFIKSLPVPYWLTYLALFILESLLVHVLAWIDGWLPAFNFDSLLMLFPMWLWGPMALMTYLNSTSAAALSSFRPLLNLDDREFGDLKYKFTNMPNRGVITSGLIWMVFYAIAVAASYNSLTTNFKFSGSFLQVIVITGLISYTIGSAIYYHSIRQLRLVNRTVEMSRQFNPFELDPIYSLSRLTARTGISWMALLVFTLLIFPVEIVPLISLILLVIQGVLAIAAFLLPLQKVHTRLLAQKRSLMNEMNARIELTIRRIHKIIDQDQLTELGMLKDTLTALNLERDFLKEIPTWPWRTGTLTSFLSALVVPVLLLLLQLAIKNWFK